LGTFKENQYFRSIGSFFRSWDYSTESEVIPYAKNYNV
jgi:hypothetical protein